MQCGLDVGSAKGKRLLEPPEHDAKTKGPLDRLHSVAIRPLSFHPDEMIAVEWPRSVNDPAALWSLHRVQVAPEGAFLWHSQHRDRIASRILCQRVKECVVNRPALRHCRDITHDQE